MAPLATDTREMLLALEPRAESARLARRALHAHRLRVLPAADRVDA